MKGKGLKLGSVTASTDAATLEAVIAELGGGIDMVLYESTNECYLSTVIKTTAGCMFDDGTTVGALKQYKDLKTTDELFTFRPVGKQVDEPKVNPYIFGAAAAITRSEDNDLNRALSIALSQMVSDGTQKQILKKWDMWHAGQDVLIRKDQ
jgi:ABC-type amino acid transport substrate-binding protein